MIISGLFKTDGADGIGDLAWSFGLNILYFLVIILLNPRLFSSRLVSDPVRRMQMRYAFTFLTMALWACPSSWRSLKQRGFLCRFKGDCQWLYVELWTRDFFAKPVGERHPFSRWLVIPILLPWQWDLTLLHPVVDTKATRHDPRLCQRLEYAPIYVSRE